jgi:hypothetical protein
MSRDGHDRPPARRGKFRPVESVTPGLSFERDLLDRASHFSEPKIDHFVMAITAAEAIVRHTAPHQTA